MEDKLLLRSFFTTRALRDPDTIAVHEYDSGAKYTYQDLLHRSLQIADYLKAFGIEKGERVALCSRNAHWSIELFYAMPIVGSILTTYNCRLKTEELLCMLEKERPKVLFYEACYAEIADKFKEIIPELITVVLDDENLLSGQTYSSIMKRKQWGGPWADINMEDIAMLGHTGGTTGIPKAAMISYRSLFYNTLNQIVDYSISNKDIIYISFPLFHMAAWSVALSVLQSGGRIIFKKVFDPEDSLRMTQSEHLTMLSGSPAVFRRMQQSPLFDNTDFSSVRGIRCGAASPSRELMERYWEKNLIFLNVFGMTESGTGILSFPVGSTTKELLIEKAGSAGKPMSFVELRIVDEAGNDVPEGENGELLIHSAQLFSGYWENEEETSHVMEQGWLRSGDIAHRDKDGFYYICGRKKHMYISNGENIYPLEIENLLLSWPEIKDTYVFGVPDPCRGEVGKALIVLTKGAVIDAQELKSRLKKQLSTIKVPQYIQFVDDIPRNEAGKVLTRVIAEKYAYCGASGRECVLERSLCGASGRPFLNCF